MLTSYLVSLIFSQDWTVVIDFPGGYHRDEVLFSSDHIRGYMISMPYCTVNTDHL